MVDSGVEEHEDLNENAWTNPEEILDGKDNDSECSSVLLVVVAPFVAA